MPRVRQSPDAVLDVRGIVDHIARDNPTAAERWCRELDRVFFEPSLPIQN
jgi:plasmid stabilization system protein ParE